jgi:carbon starvation protein
VDTRLLIIGALIFLVIGYLVYGRFVSRLMGIDPARPTPAHTRFDGVDFVPARHWLVLFGHHFSSICAAGPIVGPALAVAYWGWGPSVIWILLGGVLLGSVADFTSMVVAVRHDGRSIAQVAGEVIAPRSRIAFTVFILVALLLVLAVFAELAAGTFVQKPEIVLPSLGILPVAVLAGLFLYRGVRTRSRLVAVTFVGLAVLAGLMALGQSIQITLPVIGGLEPQTQWVVLLFLYCFVASVLPVQFLLQPRDYLSAYVLVATILLGLAGAFVINPSMNAAVSKGLTPTDWPGVGPLWPMLFVTIACGAISGFHSVVSSGTTCKQLDNERNACRIGYAAMLVESLVAILVVVAVGAGLSAAHHAELLRGQGGAITAFGEGYGSITSIFFGGYGAAFAIMALNFFILTTLDTATRLGRYLTSELFGIRNRFAPTALVVVAGAALALTGQWRTLWPAFGASNQLVAALALLVVSMWLLQRGRGALPTLIPALLMLVTTIGALVFQIFGSLTRMNPATGAWSPNWLIATVDTGLVILALFVFGEAWSVLRSRRKRVEVAAVGGS